MTPRSQLFASLYPKDTIRKISSWTYQVKQLQKILNYYHDIDKVIEYLEESPHNKSVLKHKIDLLNKQNQQNRQVTRLSLESELLAIHLLRMRDYLDIQFLQENDMKNPDIKCNDTNNKIWHWEVKNIQTSDVDQFILKSRKAEDVPEDNRMEKGLRKKCLDDLEKANKQLENSHGSKGIIIVVSLDHLYLLSQLRSEPNKESNAYTKAFWNQIAKESDITINKVIFYFLKANKTWEVNLLKD